MSKFMDDFNAALKKIYTPANMAKLVSAPNPVFTRGPTEMEKQLQDLEKIAPDICRKLKNRLGENTWRRLGYGCPGRHVEKFKKCFSEAMKAWVEQEAPGRVAEYDLECLFPEGGDPSKVDRFALARKMVGK